MNRKTRRSWWGLYLLVPFTAALLYITATRTMGNDQRTILLLATVVIVPVLALHWSEKHADLMGSEGVDARAEEDALNESGCRPGRWAPSLTGRQAHYRQVIAARASEGDRALR